jgi:hypothetical protein
MYTTCFFGWTGGPITCRVAPPPITIAATIVQKMASDR